MSDLVAEALTAYASLLEDFQDYMRSEYSVDDLRAAGDRDVLTLDAAQIAHDLDRQRVAAVRILHAEEQFGDCVEDGEPYPCRTIRILDWVPDALEAAVES